MSRMVKQLESRGVRLFWTQIDGCMFSVQLPLGELVQKPWLVLNNDPDFHMHCQTFCDQSHAHREGGMVGMRSTAVETTGYSKGRYELAKL